MDDKMSSLRMRVHLCKIGEKLAEQVPRAPRSVPRWEDGQDSRVSDSRRRVHFSSGRVALVLIIVVDVVINIIVVVIIGCVSRTD